MHVGWDADAARAAVTAADDTAFVAPDVRGISSARAALGVPWVALAMAADGAAAREFLATAAAGPLSNNIGTTPVDKARPLHTRGPDDFSGLSPHALGVWAHISRCPHQLAWGFGFLGFEFIVGIKLSLPFGGAVEYALGWSG